MTAAAEEWEPERLVVAHDKRTGLRAVIVIDSTALGPALGGIRLRQYASERAAIAECRGLARAMTLKNALADTGYGGGKAVIAWTDEVKNREAAFRAFGRLLMQLDTGQYIPASDIGTDPRDLAVVGATGVDVRGGDTETSISTAIGVHAALRSVARHVGLPATLADVCICIQGGGKVGARLARRLVADGAAVRISDVDSERAAKVAHDVGAEVIEPATALESECDLLAPCATGGVIANDVVHRLRCRGVAGAANNMLADAGVADALAARGVVLVPDFVASAGGVIQVRAIRDGWTAERLETRLNAIEDTVTSILTEADSTRRTPVNVAETLVADRLATGDMGA